MLIELFEIFASAPRRRRRPPQPAGRRARRPPFPSTGGVSLAARSGSGHGHGHQADVTTWFFMFFSQCEFGRRWRLAHDRWRWSSVVEPREAQRSSGRPVFDSWPRPGVHIDESDERDARASSMGSAVPPCLCGARQRHVARGGARVTTSAKLVAATLYRSSASTAHAARSTARHEELLVGVWLALCALAP
jgi:hypothetical protein